MTKVEMCPCGCGYPVKRENGQVVVIITRKKLSRPRLVWYGRG